MPSFVIFRDNVVWDDEQEAEAASKVSKNSTTKVASDKQGNVLYPREATYFHSYRASDQYEEDADEFWDKFYLIHQNRFFKDRQWLFTEFPELAPNGVPPESVPVRVTEEGQSCGASVADSQPQPVARTSSTECDASFPGASTKTRFFEVGCGVGNTVFPVLKTNMYEDVLRLNYVKLCIVAEILTCSCIVATSRRMPFSSYRFVVLGDYLHYAFFHQQEHEEYARGRCHAFVADVSRTDCELPFPENSLDAIILIFVLSAIHPEK
jgi:SAM-dependent methyltransferase